MTKFQSNKTPPSTQKLRGGYYTPAQLSEYLCRWAIRDPSDRVIEPSCGDGSFVRAAASRLHAGSLVAVEVVADELEKAKQSVGDNKAVEWLCGSFFRLAPALIDGERFDAAIGNPPFIRFQHFDKRERECAFALLRQFDYRPNGLANAWAAFVQLSVEMLRDGGRLAMVVPAELLQVQYAADLRFRLPLQFEQVTLVAFDELVFPQIQQEVVLLLAEGRRRNAKAPGQLRVQQVRNGDALLASAPCVARAAANGAPAGVDDWQKWTALFLQKPEAAVLRAYADSPNIHRLGDLADVDVGIVTGRNRFFVVSQEQARELQLGDRALDVVGRTSALQSTRFTDADMQHYAASNRSKLLHLSGLPRAAFSPPLAAYVAQGEAEGVDAGYKCRIRNRWFDVPSVGVPDAFLFRQIHTAPLLVANQAGATSTDTIHRTRVHTGVDRERLCGAMINSLTFASAEVGGRSYGGGVLELEPREAERLLVPYEFAASLDLDYMEERLRAGDLPSALAHGDDVLLRQGCGMSRTELKAARSGWDRLRRRRQRRRAGGTLPAASSIAPAPIAA